jgi:hypothetical protein
VKVLSWESKSSPQFNYPQKIEAKIISVLTIYTFMDGQARKKAQTILVRQGGYKYRRMKNEIPEGLL